MQISKILFVRNSYVALFAFFSFLSSVAICAPSRLSMTDYLDSVKKNNDAYEAAEKSIESSQQKVSEADLLTIPKFFTSYNHIDDKKPRTSPATMGTGLVSDLLSIGVEGQNSWGTSGKVYYTYAHNKVEGLSPLILPLSDSYSGAPAFELKQSFWRNGFGSETRSTEEILRNSQNISETTKKFEIKNLLIQAETAYLQLAIAREIVRVHTEALERSKKIRDWNTKRVNMGLADKADLLQAEAGLQLKAYDVQNAQDNEKVAARSFNSLRGLDAELVPERLDDVHESELDLSPKFKKIEEREDLQALRFSKEVAILNSKLSREKIKPTLDVSANLSYNSLDAQKADAFSDSFKTDYPYWAVGVYFSIPIDVMTTNKLNSAYSTDVMASELNYRRKKFETDKNYDDLMKSLSEAKMRLELTKKMEKLQQEKLAHEKERLYRGKTVTYQVLQFEIDYANSQLMRLKEEASIISILAQLKTYRISSMN